MADDPAKYGRPQTSDHAAWLAVPTFWTTRGGVERPSAVASSLWTWTGRLQRRARRETVVLLLAQESAAFLRVTAGRASGRPTLVRTIAPRAFARPTLARAITGLASRRPTLARAIASYVRATTSLASRRPTLARAIASYVRATTGLASRRPTLVRAIASYVRAITGLASRRPTLARAIASYVRATTGLASRRPTLVRAIASYVRATTGLPNGRPTLVRAIAARIFAIGCVARASAPAASMAACVGATLAAHALARPKFDRDALSLARDEADVARSNARRACTLPAPDFGWRTKGCPSPSIPTRRAPKERVVLLLVSSRGAAALLSTCRAIQDARAEPSERSESRRSEALRVILVIKNESTSGKA